jgi:hypothetical protein
MVAFSNKMSDAYRTVILPVEVFSCHLTTSQWAVALPLPFISYEALPSSPVPKKICRDTTCRVPTDFLNR